MAELIELGRLERDGITGLDVHRQSIVAEAHPCAKVGGFPTGSIAGEFRPLALVCVVSADIQSITIPSRSTAGGGYCGSISSSAATISVATATLLTHLWSAGTTYHGAQLVDVRVIASS